MNYGSRSQVVFQEGEGDGDSRSNTTLAKSASRIALYMMREEMKESPLESNPVQHSHDFFVISSCSVHGKLVRPVDRLEENMVSYNGMTINKNTLPGDYDSVKNVLSGFALDVNGKSGRGTQKNLTNRNIVPLQINPEAIQADCVEDGWTENDISNLMRFRDFVDGFGFKGADKRQIAGFRMTGVKALPLEMIIEASLKVRLPSLRSILLILPSYWSILIYSPLISHWSTLFAALPGDRGGGGHAEVCDSCAQQGMAPAQLQAQQVNSRF